MEINISTMTLDDLEHLKDILESEFDNFWNYDVLKNELSSDNSKYIVAKNKDNNIIGFAGIKLILDEAELMNIVTKKDMRHFGVASSMLDYLFSICRKQDIKLINLEVNTQNTIAINFYKKYNFVEVGLRKKYYDNTYDALLMTHKL